MRKHLAILTWYDGVCTHIEYTYFDIFLSAFHVYCDYAEYTSFWVCHSESHFVVRTVDQQSKNMNIWYNFLKSAIVISDGWKLYVC